MSTVSKYKEKYFNLIELLSLFVKVEIIFKSFAPWTIPILKIAIIPRIFWIYSLVEIAIINAKTDKIILNR